MVLPLWLVFNHEKFKEYINYVKRTFSFYKSMFKFRRVFCAFLVDKSYQLMEVMYHEKNFKSRMIVSRSLYSFYRLYETMIVCL